MPRNSEKTRSTSKRTVAAGANAVAAKFIFADPQRSADNFASFSKADLKADTALQANQVLEQIPAPRKSPRSCRSGTFFRQAR
jgi:hypothetical protein